ncbi:MAG: hypothetical protein AAFR54_16560, partial [Planctomycetota bacterium]
MRTDFRTGAVEMLWGGNAPAPFPLDTSDAELWYELARGWIERSRDVHGVEVADLFDPEFMYLPLAQMNTTDKITVSFQQRIDGIPVENGTVNVLFDTRGRLLSISVKGAPKLEDRGVEPTFGGGFANLVASAAFFEQHGVQATFEGNERLVHARIDDGETSRWELCWQTEVRLDDPLNPLGRLYTIDAETREILKSTTTVHFFDVFGTVRSNATPGLTADRAANPPVPIPMPRVRVQSSAGTVETDRDGNFNIVGVNTSVDITLTFFGEFTNINNDQGADHSVTITNVLPNQQNDLLMNPSPTEFITSQANAQLHTNGLRDWIVDRFPTDDTADFRAPANVNINDSCNAFFNGSSTNYFVQGGGCNNTAFSTVVAHELGHWLNSRYGTGNGADGMGEGNADVFAMYYLDDPVVGRFFSTNGGFVRNGTNTRQFCGDTNPGCHNNGSPHRDGEVWMGAAWKIRTNLVSSLGTVSGEMAADLLFLGWLNTFNQTTIRSVIEDQWLTLDDDDGNIGNGTPNFTAIDAGFRQQGFPGVDLDFLTVSAVTELPDVPTASGPYVVEATVETNLGTNVAGASIVYAPLGSPLQTAPMSLIGPNRWRGEIPDLGSDDRVRYWIEATDDAGNAETLPEVAPLQFQSFSIGGRTDIVASSFDNASAGFVAGAASDTATTGVWTRGNPNGTDAQPEDDFTPVGSACWFTGQAAPGDGLGANDIDGGATTLLSAPFDGQDANVLILEYARWYSNDEGNAPNADVFDVDVSTDGGVNWTRVERIGPSGTGTSGGWIQRSVDLAQIVTPTADMQIRFVASDFPDGSIVEAAVDDFAVYVLGDIIPDPTNYCSTTVNSTGGAATMSSGGSISIADNSFVLGANGVVPGAFGLFFFGPDQTDVPLANSEGRLCITTSILRLPIVQADVFSGTAFYGLD